ncbi:MAG: hypothetical protein LUD72_07410 [Bacteroidales bacterium]|nr:hypothetical protein [Bacteroidales bacterium]
MALRKEEIRYEDVTEKFGEAMETFEDFASLAEKFLVGILKKHNSDEVVFEDDASGGFERVFLDDESQTLMVVDKDDENIVVDFRDGLASPFDQMGIVDAVLGNFGYKVNES